MEWYAIEYLYPTSFKKFEETMFPNVGLISISVLKYFDIKKLYSFFENEGIQLIIENYNPIFWTYTISINNKLSIFSNTTCCEQKREEIEEDAFLECFKLLEKKLNYENYLY